MALIAIWLLDDIVSFLVFRPTDAFGQGLEQSFIVTVLQFAYRLLLPLLFGIGLLKRMHFAWILAFVWQALSASFGVLTFTLGSYGWSDITSQIGLYGGALPIIVGVVSFVILLLPTIQRWVRSD